VTRSLARRLSKSQSFVSCYERGQYRVDFLEFAHIISTLGSDPHEGGSDLLKLVTGQVGIAAA